MTLVTDALDRVARQVSIEPPSAWLSATDPEYKEIRDDFLLEAVDDILDRVDISDPIGRQQTLTGDGSTNYALNSDFKRLQRDQMAIYDNTRDIPAVPITTDGEWSYLTDLGAGGVTRYYRVKGWEGNHTIDLYDALATGDTVTVSYVSTRWIRDNVNADTYKSSFTDATDTLLLPRRLVEAGIVWRWRERKGLPFVAKYNEYQALMAQLSNDGRQRKVIDFGGSGGHVHWTDLVPATIPSS